MRRNLQGMLTIIFSIAGGGLASAADLPVKAPMAPAQVVAASYNWSGWYVGGNIGYGWGNSSDPGLTFVDPGGAFGFPPFFAAGGNVTPDLKPKGVIGGGQVGFNWAPTPNWVAGLVTDFQGSGMKDSATATVTPAAFPVTSIQTNSEHIDWFGTVRAKLGFTQNNWLLYGTGGLAYGQVSTSGSNNIIVVPGGFFTGSQHTTNVGWTAGAGLNYALTSNWIVGVEYLYIDLGHVTYTELAPSFPAVSLSISNRATAQIARATLDYKF